MHVGSHRGDRFRLVARGVAAGQGKTEGYHERTDIAFATATARALGRKGERDKLAEFAQAQLEEVEDVMKALRFGWAWVGRGRLRACVRRIRISQRWSAPSRSSNSGIWTR